MGGEDLCECCLQRKHQLFVSLRYDTTKERGSEGVRGREEEEKRREENQKEEDVRDRGDRGMRRGKRDGCLHFLQVRSREWMREEGRHLCALQ